MKKVKLFTLTPKETAESIIPEKFRKGRPLIKKTIYPNGAPQMSKFNPKVEWYGI